ncbi:putative neutral ceramidase C [Apostichopus japonicus]|uniref:putative neutral ceramidase C n=1 Tax=Stichopus japonicus TaxID=307972 RepID=UPI003AB68BF1
MKAISCVFAFILGVALGQDPNFIVGVGIEDVTGPAADVNMMGYAHPGQTSRGIHTRLYSRAFIFCEVGNSDKCEVFVVVDFAMGATAINIGVFERLKTLYGSMYTEKNVAICGTHTHSGPAGYLQYFVFDATSQGFVHDAYDNLVEGIFQSIRIAHENRAPSFVYHSTGELLDANINRSPYAYEANPANERARYTHDVDKVMTVLKILGEDMSDRGLISFFPVHPVSMNNTNRLLSSDNKGYASYIIEMEKNPGTFHGQGDFVAAFANTNQGDVSPNLEGAKCLDTGEDCDRITSTCNGRTALCVGVGPGKDMFESTKIIGERQANKAMELYNSAGHLLDGTVGFVHQHVDMTDFDVELDGGGTVKTCKGAFGYSFAAGATDGAGFFPFTQSETETMPYLEVLRDALLKEPSAELVACQAPKPVLLPIGEMHTPWEWAPSIIDTQMLRLGEFVIIVVPAEFSTMAGRRLRETITDYLENDGLSGAAAEIVGLSNTYSDYVVTEEEYQTQRYEAASTIFGPNTLRAYQQQYTYLSEKLMEGSQPTQGPPIPNLLAEMGTTLADPEGDEDDVNIVTGLGPKIGELIMDTDAKYRQGGVAMATFIAGNPRNDVFRMRDDTFLKVQRRVGLGNNWNDVYTDADFCTRFLWDRASTSRRGGSVSHATVVWDIPLDQTLGDYRLAHKGYRKDSVKGDIFCYEESYSSAFEVVSASYTEDRTSSSS